jgi:hypothetical protein
MKYIVKMIHILIIPRKPAKRGVTRAPIDTVMPYIEDKQLLSGGRVNRVIPLSDEYTKLDVGETRP